MDTLQALLYFLSGKEASCECQCLPRLTDTVEIASSQATAVFTVSTDVTPESFKLLKQLSSLGWKALHLPVASLCLYSSCLLAEKFCAAGV